MFADGSENVTQLPPGLNQSELNHRTLVPVTNRL